MGYFVASPVEAPFGEETGAPIQALAANSRSHPNREFVLA
jgi:hypothetical protein